MFFRNLSMMRFSEAVAEAVRPTLDASLAEKPLNPCGPLEQSSAGFVSPHGRDGENLTHSVGGFTLVALGGEERQLPSSVVNEALAKRLADITRNENRRVGGKERKRLKDDIIVDLLPRAFVKSSRVFGYFDFAGGWFVVDTSSRRVLEDFVGELRSAIGTLPMVPLAPEESARTLMTDWVTHGKLPPGLALGDECELRDPAESGAVVRCRHLDLETDEVREHLKTGKQVFQLGLTFDDRISFVLGEDLVIRKLRFLDQVLDELGETQTDSAAAELDARMALMTLEVERLLAKLDEWFGLPRPTER